MDMILRNASVTGIAGLVDIGIEGGRIAAIAPKLAASGQELDLGGRFVTPPFCETHIHRRRIASPATRFSVTWTCWSPPRTSVTDSGRPSQPRN